MCKYLLSYLGVCNVNIALAESEMLEFCAVCACVYNIFVDKFTFQESYVRFSVLFGFYRSHGNWMVTNSHELESLYLCVVSRKTKRYCGLF